MGSIICKIQQNPIDFLFFSEKLNNFTDGAAIWFLGKVRKINLNIDNEVEIVRGITYESYEILAEKILNEICVIAQEKFDKALNIVVVHRVGYLAVAECSIIIGVSSLHRGPAYEASRFILEEIKKRVPIWKLEHYESGNSKWLKGQSLNQELREPL